MGCKPVCARISCVSCRERFRSPKGLDVQALRSAIANRQMADERDVNSIQRLLLAGKSLPIARVGYFNSSGVQLHRRRHVIEGTPLYGGCRLAS